MFEERINSIIRYNLNKLENLGSVVSFKDLETNDFSESLLNYISADLEYEVYKKHFLNNESGFKYSSNAVISAVSLLTGDLKNSVDLKKINIEETIKSGVKDLINYLSLPNRTLLSFVFKREQEIEVNDLYFKLNYFSYYDHIRKAVNAYFLKKRASVVTASQFSELLGRIDALVAEYEKEKVVSMAIKSISDFYNQETKKYSYINCQALERFFKEREFYDEIKKLSDDLDIDNTTECRIYDIYKSLGFELEAAEYLDLKETEKETADFVMEEEMDFETEQELKPEDHEEKIPVEPDDEISKSKDTFVVDEKNQEIIFQDEIDKITEENPEEEKIEIEEKKNSDAETEKRLRKEKQQKEEVYLEEKSGIDLFELFKNKNVSKIVTTVFHNDVDDFASAVEKLNECNNYEDAMTELEKILAARRVKPKSKEAVLFQEMIGEYFEQK